MTNLQRTSPSASDDTPTMTVENHLDAILDDHDVIRFSNNNKRTHDETGSPRRGEHRRNRRAHSGLISTTPTPHPTARGVLDGPQRPSTPTREHRLIDSPAPPRPFPLSFPSEVPRPDLVDRHDVHHDR